MQTKLSKYGILKRMHCLASYLNVVSCLQSDQGHSRYVTFRNLRGELTMISYVDWDGFISASARIKVMHITKQ